MSVGEPAPTEELLAGALAGDGRASDALFRRYYPFALRVVGLRLGETMRRVLDREDLVQDALLLAFRRLDRFEYRSEGSFKSWLATIVTNRVRDAWREGATRKRGELRERAPALEATSILVDSVLPAGSPTPSAAAAALELGERIEAALLALPERERRAVELRRLCGQDYAEVAAELALPGEAAARALVSRALARLADSL